MKKIVLVFALIATVTAAVLGFSACNKKKNDSVDLSGNISYAETHKYMGSDNDFRVTVASGIKEKLHIADGVAKDVAPFTTISVAPQKSDLLNKDYSFVLAYEGGEVSGALKRDVVTHNFVADIDLGDNTSKVLSLKIVYGENAVDIKLSDMLSGKKTYLEALDIAAAELKTEISSAATDGVLQREVCIKLIRDRRNPDSPMFWYVGFISAENGYWAVIIQPESGEIVSKKV